MKSFALYVRPRKIFDQQCSWKLEPDPDRLNFVAKSLMSPSANRWTIRSRSSSVVTARLPVMLSTPGTSDSIPSRSVSRSCQMIWWTSGPSF